MSVPVQELSGQAVADQGGMPTIALLEVIASLVAAVQDLQARVDELEAP
jgi:hypothetical protein